MQYTHNESIITMNRASKVGLTVTYRLFETGLDASPSYSALISLQLENGDEEDYFIPDISNNRMGALVLFEKLCRNTVLPCEVSDIYSDGFAEIL